MSPSDPYDSATRLLHDGRPGQAEQVLAGAAGDRRCAARLRELLIGERKLAQAQAVARALAAGDDSEATISSAFLRHLEQDFATAAQLCQQALQIDPGHPAALNHLGRALHNMGRTEEALAAFEQALAADPGYSEAWHNIGHVLRARGQLHRARQAFETALEHAPGFLAARLQLGITLYAMEHPLEALGCFEQVLEQQPDDVEARNGAGLALHLLGRLGEARSHYARSLQIAPDNPATHYYMGVLSNELADQAAATEHLQRALQLQPDDIEALTELAGVHEQSSRLEQADAAVQRGLQLAPLHPAMNLEAAKLERRRGDARAAANRLKRLDPRRLPLRTAQQYWFELGQALDRCDDVAGAMHAFETGNTLAARSVRRQAIDPGAFDRKLDRLLDWTRSGAAGARPAPGDPVDDTGGDLCFLVGMPRSGTTLLDTMLAAHPALQSIEELPTLEHAIARIAELPDGYPAALDRLQPDDIRTLRESYRRAVAQHLDGSSAPLLIDKLPLRCLHVGLIQRLFPAARVLFALRHPGDVVLSNFMQQYAPNEAFIHFDTLQESARIHARVMELWQAGLDRLALRVEYVRYEALIDDPATELQKLCRFLDIEPDPAMLDQQARQATRERVRTNSYQQVAEPIYQRARGRWQRYRPYLEPCLDALRPSAELFGYRLD